MPTHNTDFAPVSTSPLTGRLPSPLSRPPQGAGSRRRSRLAACLLLVACSALLWWPDRTPAQNIQHTENKADQAMKGDFRVDPSTLGMGMTIPLGSYAGRGGLSIPLSLTYSSKVWRIDFTRSFLDAFQRPISELSAKYAENSVSGWTSSLDIPLIEFTGREQYYDAQGQGVCEDCDPEMQSTEPYYYVKRIHLHLPDGSAHELRTDDAQQVRNWNQPLDFTGVFYAVDGSSTKYDSANRTLHLPDGSRYLFGTTEVGVRGRWGLPATHYIDRNGNTLAYDAANRQWTDTLGRIISNPLPAEPPADPTQTPQTYYQVKRAAGGEATYTFHWKHLAQALTDPGQQLRYTGDAHCNRTLSPPTVSPALFDSSTHNYLCSELDAQYTNPALFNPVVLSKIDLPTGQSYTFTYNEYGEIDKVSLPTGGFEQYSYGEVAPLSYTTELYKQANRGVTQRSVSVDGSNTGLLHWQYTSTGGYPYTVRVTAPDNTYTERLLFTGRLNPNDPPVMFGFDDALTGKTYEERAYSAAGQMLRRSLSQWLAMTPPGSRPRDPHVTKTVNLLLDTGGAALAATTEMHYDNDLNLDWAKSYDFAAVDATTAQTGEIGMIPRGVLVRTDETTYLVNDSSIDAGIKQAYRDLVGLPTSTRVKNAADAIVARTNRGYDQGTLYDCPGITGHDAAYHTGFTVRGNVTAATVYEDAANWGGARTTWMAYDIAGNLIASTDPRNQQSWIGYSDSFYDGANRNTYAYPTHTTSPVPDPTNTRATNTPLETWTTYDFATGKVRRTTDANYKVTTYQYDDVLDRLRKVERPDGGWTKYEYGRSNNAGAYNDYVRTLTAMNGTQSVESYQFFDGLGRGARSFLSEGGAPLVFSTTDTQYDAMGRVWRVSNPYRTNGSNDSINPSGVWTTTAYDALGRAVTVTTPDNAQVTTAYSGNTVTVTDQKGKSRRSVTDALGRLTQVMEDPTGLAYATDYTYDALGNLRQVAQGQQRRYFMYDSLSRLVRARNPEQAVNGNLNTAADPVSGNTQWSLSYAYDANGNLAARTDARGVNTSYVYDNINRVKQTTYSNGTPYTLNTYDFAANGRGRFYADYESSTTGTINYVLAYDAMGRATSGKTEFYKLGTGWLPGYTSSRAYDLMGHVTAQTYPSGHTVNYRYDAAGRLGDDGVGYAFSGNLGDGVTRAYAWNVQYDAASRMTGEQYGTQTPLYHSLGYNVRGQLYLVQLGTGAFGSWNRGMLVNHYGNNDYTTWGASGTDNNGNVLRSHHYVPNDDQISGWSLNYQDYSYDSLNRLTAQVETAGQNTGGWFAANRQSYAYDRYGNRTIDLGQTWGQGIPAPQYSVDPSTNRLGVPAGYASTMGYDLAGNLTYDNHSPNTIAGSRTYDAEGRMTATYYTNNALASSYIYDAAGRRVRRNVPGGEVWQVYGMEGELVAEYAAGAAPSQPQKEYGYRNGELLITATSNGQGSAFPVANSGFETPALGGGNFQYTPGNATWAFTGGGGISGNNSGFTSGNPPAPEGAQVAFLQGTNSTLTQTVSGFHANTPYTVRFAAAQRGNASGNSQDFEVFIDNTSLGVYRPAGAGYAELSTGSFTTTTGAHVLKFVGRNTNGGDNTAFIDKVRVSLAGAGEVNWLVSDHLGTPRMVADQTGSLAGIKRHDYLPFGEELGAGVGGRTTTQGYVQDNVAQKFTGQIRDGETGLDYFGARYYASTQGRFTSPDVFWKDSQVSHPQSWNKYAYVRNNPLKFIDPSGEKATVKIETDEDKKKGKITVTASIAIWTSNKSGVSQKDLQKAAQEYKSNIEQAWSGTYEQNGITYEVSVTVDVQAFESRDAANNSFDGNVQNVLEVTPVGGHSGMRPASVLGGPDRGEIALDAGTRKSEMAHEFTHLLGVDNRYSGAYLSNTYGAQRAQSATAYDYGWAFGGEINNHRFASRPIEGGRRWETLNAGGGTRGKERSHTSTRELGAPISWWR